MNGRILLLPIVGNGNAVVTFRAGKVTCEMQGGVFQKQGVKYLEMAKAAVNLIPGKIEFKFDNLFEGDERLGNEMNRVSMTTGKKFGEMLNEIMKRH
ncbi:hypothetical protein ILUMI_05357 [Ignelater luminosus]|uniref:Uncharacterized protein n=1 Tax=Ignelater luminosus TaxID=2038154 RepID=A0A8K0D7E9_IGNLU|nr:hypothetical protein ILUMI_05357 [Ignelater luminosus]